jgi:hypothetical protein
MREPIVHTKGWGFKCAADKLVAKQADVEQSRAERNMAECYFGWLPISVSAALGGELFVDSGSVHTRASHRTRGCMGVRVRGAGVSEICSDIVRSHTSHRVQSRAHGMSAHGTTQISECVKDMRPAR